MKITAPWLTQAATRRAIAALTTDGHEAYFVGGCVRNALLGAPATDIDIATNAHPETVMALARSAGLRAVGTGIDHGTVSIIIGAEAFEVTTFRRDVETDGRHAVVAFSDTTAEDAARRDFTINALYADGTGVVQDPTGQGLDDLAARRIRFIGMAHDRIAEDFLRILRYFRFHAWYADQSAGFDPDALAAIADGLDGLASLSAERVGHEMRKLLAAPDPAPALCTMAKIGVLPVILPGATPEYLAPLVAAEAAGGFRPDWRRRLAVLGGDAVADRLRLSRAETKALSDRQAGMGSVDTAGALGYRLGAGAATDVLLGRAALGSTALDPADLATAKGGANAAFPIVAADLMPAYQGKDLGERLRMLERRWIASGFSLSREELLR